MKKQSPSRYIITAALIASSYTALTYLSSAFGLAYSGMQFRLSETLNVLAAFTPATIPGLTIGCVLSNIASPFGIIDIVLGAIATLLSAITIRIISKTKIKHPAFFMALPPAILNGLVVGLQTALFTTDSARLTIFAISFIQVFISEIVICMALGIPFYKILKHKFKKLF